MLSAFAILCYLVLAVGVVFSIKLARCRQSGESFLRKGRNALIETRSEASPRNAARPCVDGSMVGRDLRYVAAALDQLGQRPACLNGEPQRLVRSTKTTYRLAPDRSAR